MKGKRYPQYSRVTNYFILKRDILSAKETRLTYKERILFSVYVCLLNFSKFPSYKGLHNFRQLIENIFQPYKSRIANDIIEEILKEEKEN